MALFCFFLFVGLFVYLIQRTCGAEGIDCGFHFTSQSGKFSSPGYPNNYSPNLFCVWTVRVNGNNPEIKLTFREFNLAPKHANGECLDYVTVYSGNTPRTDRLIGKYCDSNAPSSLLIKEAAVYIKFITNEDEITESGFVISFSTSSSKSSITSSHATAGIVAAIFCGIVFLGVGAMRCIMMGACHRCQSEPAANRECIGTNETVSNYVMDCPPSYRTVMEHPERYPTPNMSPHISPISTPRASHEQNEQDDDDDDDDEDDGEPPPPYSRVIPERQTPASIDLESNTAGTNPPCSRVERTIPVYHNSADNNDIVTIHNNLNSPDEERELETNTRISEDERNERTSSNRRSHYNIASTGHPVLSANCEHSSHNDDSPARNSSNGASSGSLSILNHNNEMLDNYYDEPHNNVACNSSVVIAEGHKNGCDPGTTGDPKNNNSTPTGSATATSRSISLEVWL